MDLHESRLLRQPVDRQAAFCPVNARILEISKLLRRRANPTDLPRIWDYLRRVSGDPSIVISTVEQANVLSPEALSDALGNILAALREDDWTAIDLVVS